ncbi:SIR2 family protein [Hyalangium rubrum]|uniref:SIR2 family protein n=1 Tax=Hyalangium rubrum TaxID=3103134 RepID=A0ABU5HGC3_9BACT|nr:SIR2 family protein [Hyalangium sp. s54d21]MDY7232504.1 SIR2 family protein [Hyalangium sp. s54d21]
MISWPIDLVEDIARRRTVLFLGAGVSKNSVNDKGERPKDWKEFLLHLAAQLPAGPQQDAVNLAISESDLLTACDLAKRYLRSDVFKKVVLAEYSDKRFQPAQIHDDIVALDSRFVVTTNFDKLYENRANQIQQNTVIVKNYYDTDVADVLRRDQRVVLKVHGSIDSVDRTVFTRSSYAQARNAHGGFYRMLGALFLTHTFIFLGASMRDPDIQLVLEDHAYKFPGSRPHYVVMPSGSVSQGVLEIMEESMNLRPILYDPTGHHAELAASLKALLAPVEDERERLTKTLDW